jgi:hypothetical protein
LVKWENESKALQTLKSQFYTNLSLLYLTKQELSLAKLYALKAFATQPNSSIALNSLIFVELKLNNRAEALYLIRFHRLSMSNLEILNTNNSITSNGNNLEFNGFNNGAKPNLGSSGINERDINIIPSSSIPSRSVSAPKASPPTKLQSSSSLGSAKKQVRNK